MCYVLYVLGAELHIIASREHVDLLFGVCLCLVCVCVFVCVCMCVCVSGVCCV